MLPLSVEDYKCVLRIERIGGKVRIHRTTNCVESVSNFPSVRLSKLVLFPVHNVGSMLNLKKSYHMRMLLQNENLQKTDVMFVVVLDLETQIMKVFMK